MINRKKIGKKMLAAILCGALICTSAVPAMAAEVEGPTIEESVSQVEETIAEESLSQGENPATEGTGMQAEELATEETGMQDENPVAKESGMQDEEPATEETGMQDQNPVTEKTGIQDENPMAEEGTELVEGEEAVVDATSEADETEEKTTEPVIQTLEAADNVSITNPNSYGDCSTELSNTNVKTISFTNDTEKFVNISFSVLTESHDQVKVTFSDSENIYYINNNDSSYRSVECKSGEIVSISFMSSSASIENKVKCDIYYSVDEIKTNWEIYADDEGYLYDKEEGINSAVHEIDIWCSDYAEPQNEFEIVNRTGTTLLFECRINSVGDNIITINNQRYQGTADWDEPEIVSFVVKNNGNLKIKVEKSDHYELNFVGVPENAKKEYDVTEENGNKVITFNYKENCESNFSTNGVSGKAYYVNGSNVPVAYSIRGQLGYVEPNAVLKVNGEKLKIETERFGGDGESWGYTTVVVEPGGRVEVEYDSNTWQMSAWISHKIKENIKKAATCTEDGQAEYICSEEGCKGKVFGSKILPALGHSIKIDPAVAATCTTPGKTEGSHCERCGTVLTEQKEIPATGHSFGDWVVEKQPTVFEDGMKAQTCAVCGARVEEVVAKLQPAGKLSMATVPLKVKQTTTALKVTDMAAGDAVDSFVSSDTKIATVDRRSGKITAKKKGTATITVTLKSGLKLTAKVKVQTGNVKTTKITANVAKISLDMKKTFQLKTVVAPLTSKEKVTFKSSNSKIVTVSKTGKLTAKKPGKATITVKSGKKKCYVKVTVNPVKTTGITVNKTQVKLKVKKSFTLKTKLTPGNSTEAVTYKTSNKKVATVSNKGKITAKKAGTATITVKSGNQSVKVQVTVTKK